MRTKWWNTWLAVPGCTHRRPSKLNSGMSASSAPSARAARDVVGEQLADARPVRDEAALAELAAAHDEELSVAGRRRRGAARTPRRRAARARSRGRRSCGRSGRAAGLAGCPATPRRRRAADGPRRGRTGTGCARRCRGVAGSRSGDGLQQLVGHRPVEQAANDAEQVVEAARPRPGPGREEVVEQRRCQLVEPVDIDARRRSAPAAEVRPPRCRYLRPSARLWARKSIDGAAQVLGHRSTSSPSPRATSRSASTATLA